LLYPIAAAAALVLSSGPVRDPDVYWHVRLGGELLRTHSIHAAGSNWSLTAAHGTWTSSEWLAEVALHGFVSAFGWQGMLIFQGVVAALLLAAVAAAVRPGRDPRARAVVFAIMVISLAPFFQARPQSISLVLLAWLGILCRNVLLERRAPNVPLFLCVVLVWAQLHGLWILAPLFIAGAAVLRLLDSRCADDLRFTGRAIGIAVLGLAAGCINPLGLRSLTLPFTLHGATSTISEWQPTTLMPYFTWGFFVLVAVQVSRWRHDGRNVPRAELAWTGLLVVFAFMAFRNVPTAILLLGPVVAVRVSHPRPTPPTSRREQRALTAALAVLTLVVLGLDGVASTLGTAIPHNAPTRLAASLDDGTPHRVLDAYNTGGVVLAFGGPEVRVGIDGRADYYGGDYIQRYSDMIAMRGGWQRLFNKLNPDAAIIETKAPLSEWLRQHGWDRTATQGTYSLFLKS
jgi:hypothetical protein